MKQLTYIGTDDWEQPVYEDENGRLWKDINLGRGEPHLHSSSNNEFDGEADTPLIGDYKITNPQEPVDEGMRFNYMMLSRLQMDCKYFLGYGNRSSNILWGITPKEHIAEMKKLWNNFPDDAKPECLTWAEILKYEQDMQSE